MKKFILPLLLILAVGMLAAVESEPSEVVGYVKYDCVTGLNFIALPMDTGYNMASDLAVTYPGIMDAINYWDPITQSWVAAQYIPDFEIWDGDFSVAPGKALMINALSNFAFYSIGNMPAQNATYNIIVGLNSLMIPLNKSEITMASELGTAISVVDAINDWDEITQSWVAAQYIPDFEIWDGDFALYIGMPLMVNSTGITTWPARFSNTYQIRSSH